VPLIQQHVLLNVLLQTLLALLAMQLVQLVQLLMKQLPSKLSLFSIEKCTGKAV